jgi:hypothetical protein
MFDAKKRIVGLGAILVALALVPAAGAKTAHPYSAQENIATLQTANGYPKPGGTAVTVGTLRSSAFGSGALVARVTITGQQGTVFTFKGSEVDFFALGTQRDTYTGTATVQSDGSQLLVIRGKYISGTGRYRGATGHFTFHGKIPPGSTVVTGASTGSLTF